MITTANIADQIANAIEWQPEPPAQWKPESKAVAKFINAFSSYFTGRVLTLDCFDRPDSLVFARECVMGVSALDSEEAKAFFMTFDEYANFDSAIDRYVKARYEGNLYELLYSLWNLLIAAAIKFEHSGDKHYLNCLLNTVMRIQKVESCLVQVAA